MPLLWTTVISLLLLNHVTTGGEEEENLLPTVVVAIFVRNKAHTLPYFLTLFGRLDYPKQRMSLYIRSDHNEDASTNILHAWLEQEQDKYHSVDIKMQEELELDHSNPLQWTESRFRRIMELKEGGLGQARRMWADLVWFLDADVFLTRRSTLHDLVGKGHIVTAPLLNSLGPYANFWADMNEQYYYQRGDNYFPILERKTLGCFAVPMVHSSVLVDLRKTGSRVLTFLPEKVPGYVGPKDDIIVFAVSAKFTGTPMHVCNDEEYGYLMQPLDEDQKLQDDHQNLVNLKLQMIAFEGPLTVDNQLSRFLPPMPPKDSLGVDQVYLINLRRRPDRKLKMDACLDELGVGYQLVEAVDGLDMDEAYLVEKGIKMLPKYSDRYHKRPMTFGEVGCFLSHYGVWTDAIAKGYERIIVLEDDIRFEPFFRQKLSSLLVELGELDWDLVYLGRKIMENANEPWLPGSSGLVKVDYAYWTLGYLLTNSAARKLVEEQPLSKMVPVDEYLPIMYDRHPNATWKEHFRERSLRALSAEPRLLFPTYYTGEEGYVSDTEATPTIASFGEGRDEL